MGFMIGALTCFGGFIAAIVVMMLDERKAVRRMNALKQPPLTAAERAEIRARIQGAPQYVDDGMIYPPPSGSVPQWPRSRLHPEYEIRETKEGPYYYDPAEV